MKYPVLLSNTTHMLNHIILPVVKWKNHHIMAYTDSGWQLYLADELVCSSQWPDTINHMCGNDH